MRVFLIVLDSFGIGELPDADEYQDLGSDTLRAVYQTEHLHIPHMKKLGLFHIDGIVYGEKEETPVGAYARMAEASKGKDTTIGHWEIAGVISPKPLPTYPGGFPPQIIEEFEKKTGRKVLCNRPYSGTDVIRDYGQEHIDTGALIVYTSADSVFQIAAHEEIVPVQELYQYCKIARALLVGDHGVGRVIARPFTGTAPNFTRTSNRHDFSLQPPKKTMLDLLKEAGKDVIAVGKINDIFAGRGITEYIRTSGNPDGIEKTIAYTKKDFDGLCFVNLVDFDMLYGHRNDADGYAKALSFFDHQLPHIVSGLQPDDVLMLTADHGCDPFTISTDHSREYTPLLITGQKVSAVNLGTRATFSDIAATVLDLFQIQYADISGESLKSKFYNIGGEEK